MPDNSAPTEDLTAHRVQEHRCSRYSFVYCMCAPGYCGVADGQSRWGEALDAEIARVCGEDK
jgi:hypothetical protein